MITPRSISYEDAAPLVTWPETVAALRNGHALPKAQVGDIFLGPSEGSLLNRGAFIEGLGFGVKSVTVFGDNPSAGLPSIQSAGIPWSCNTTMENSESTDEQCGMRNELTCRSR